MLVGTVDTDLTTPEAVRTAARDGALRGHTGALAPAYAQANLVILPRDLAGDFQTFCERNPKPCPLLDITQPGSPEPVNIAPGADVRTDIPRYRVYRDGVLTEERDDLVDLWQDDFVAFLLGCSFTFEGSLIEAGAPVRHVDHGRNVPMYQTTWPCEPAGPFAGPLVVTMRAMPEHLIDTAIAVTERYPAVHGGPVHIGDPDMLGIADLDQPEWGDPPVIESGDVPVFWACGVTPQAVALAARPSLMLTHAPGHMLVTDVPVASLAVS
ncbi:MAG: putative hydro-lyase [Thermomicrobiales bacterium]